MSSLIEHVERAEIARWEAIFNEDPKCESPGHWRTPEDHGGPGVTRMYCPCGYNGIICGTFRELLVHSTRGFWCAYTMRHENTDLRFIEL